MSFNSRAGAPTAFGWDQLLSDLNAAADVLASLRAELEHPPRYFGEVYLDLFSVTPGNPVVQKRVVAQYFSADALATLHEHQLPRAQTDLHALTQQVQGLHTNVSGGAIGIEIKLQFAALEQAFEAPLGRYRHLLSALATPNYIRAFDLAVQNEAHRRLTVTAIALRRFQLRNGRYPAALAELVPQYLPAELIDPWSGRPFRHRVDADGQFTLYSVGGDGRDDGGDPAPATSTNAPPDLWSGKDAVWPTPVFPQSAPGN